MRSRSFDPDIVMRDHSDHKEVDNFSSFHKSHVRFLAMVESGKLSSPEELEQSVVALADALNKKFTLYIGTLKDEVIKYSMKKHPEKFDL
jgi:hypothetical protein